MRLRYMRMRRSQYGAVLWLGRHSSRRVDRRRGPEGATDPGNNHSHPTGIERYVGGKRIFARCVIRVRTEFLIARVRGNMGM